jgi:hypothetical protein
VEECLIEGLEFNPQYHKKKKKKTKTKKNKQTKKPGEEKRILLS